MKRVDRAHLEPFFRLHRDAHLNIIRNWVGQNSEESFDLADEYGLMVLSDFWESTQDYNMEAEDPQLFLANATDVVRRFRNHPSIVAWFGRNEGVPQPILNSGLDTLLRTEDGTRLYMPSSNAVNLQGRGPITGGRRSTISRRWPRASRSRSARPRSRRWRRGSAPSRPRRIAGRSAMSGPITTGTRPGTARSRASPTRWKNASARRRASRISSARRR